MSLSPQIMQNEDADLDAVAQSILAGVGEPRDPATAPSGEPEVDVDDRDPAQAGVDPDADEPADDGTPLDEGDEEQEFEQDADAETDEDESEDEGEDDAEDFEDVFTVMADGKPYQATLDELKQDFSGRKAIQHRMEHAATLQKQNAEVHDQLVKHRDDYKTRLDALEAYVGQGANPNIDWDALYAEDPQEWAIQREQHRQREEQQAAIAAEKKRVADEQQAEQEAQFKVYMQQQAKHLGEVVPELMDPEKAAPLYQDLVGYAAKFGFAPEDVNGVNDARAMHLLHHAYSLEQGSVKAAGKQTRKRRKKRVVRPGTGTRANPQRQQAKRKERQLERARQTGHPDDVAKTLLTSG